LQLYICVQLAGSMCACAHVSASEVFPVLESSFINVKLVTDVLQAAALSTLERPLAT
jgi:hypothetical protein